LTQHVVGYLRFIADTLDTTQPTLATLFRELANVYQLSVLNRTNDLSFDLAVKEDRVTQLVMTYQDRVDEALRTLDERVAALELRR
jgi:uncharacterized protein YoxC